MTIHVSTENLIFLENTAVQYNLDVNELMQQALKRYLRYLEEKKIEMEKRGFLRQHKQLKQKYMGLFIAMHQGKVVDHDQDMVTLHQRIRRDYGRKAILIRRVEEEADRPIMVRSPRLSWVQS